MAEFYQAQKSAVTYPSLVLNQVKILQDITKHELRDSTKVIKTPIGEQIIESEDTRYSFLQSAEFFGTMLSPYFDDETSTLFNDFLKLYDSELVDVIEEEEFKTKVAKIFNIKDAKKELEINPKFKSALLTFFLNEKCKQARALIRKLIECFKNNNFLGESLYSEGEADDGLTAEVDEETELEVAENENSESSL